MLSTMKTTLLAAILVALTFTAHGQLGLSPLPSTYAVTNVLPGQTPMTAILAPTAIAPPLPLNVWLTNSVGGPDAGYRPSTLIKEIQLTLAGAEATFGRHKVSFTSDISAARPITVTGPDGRVLAFRPTLLVLANRATGESYVLCEVTSRIGLILLPDRVLFTNALDTAPGPSVDLEYVYDGDKSLEQNLLLHACPSLPSAWREADAVLEFWTEFDSMPLATQTATVTLRGATQTVPAIQASDETADFGAMKVVAGGRAFSFGAQQDSVAVAKSWVQAQDPISPGLVRVFLIETLDWTALRQQFAALPKSSYRASATNLKRSRGELLRWAASRPTEGSPGLVATLPVNFPLSTSEGERAGVRGAFQSTTNHSSATSPMLIAQAPPRSSTDVLLDFTIVNTVPVPAGIISWWPAGANALDAITNHNNGYLSNGVSYAAGEVGQAFTFNGVNQVVGVPSATSLNPTNGLTQEAWIYVSSYPTNNAVSIFGKDDPYGVRQYLLGLAYVNNQWVLRAHVGVTGGFYYYNGTTNIQSQTWYHVAMTYDGSSLKIFINGSQDGSASVTGPIITGTPRLLIGGSVPGPWNLNGLVDELSIYNRALSQTEIQSIYNAGAAGKVNPNCVSPSTNAVGWWAGDGNAYDLAHTNFGTLHNGVTYKSAVVGQAFSLDGVAGYVQVPNAPDLNPTNALTIESWIFLNQFNGNHSIIRKDGECANRQFLLTVGPNQKFRAHVGRTNGYVWTDGATTVSTQTWYHVAMTYNAISNKLSIYVNGALDAAATVSGTMITTTEPVYIGGDPYPGCAQYYFPGLIDEPTIYNRALSGTEISAIYSAGCGGKCRTDADSDGLTDLQEAFLGTNPNNASTSGDGISDGVKFFQGGNLFVSGALADTNGLINLQIYTP